MKNTTRNALLIAFFSQKPSKKDVPFVYGLSIICATLIIIGAMLESSFLFRLGLGLIFVVPMTRGSFNGFMKNRDTAYRTEHIIHFSAAITMGTLFLIGLIASVGEMFVFAFLGLLAIPVTEGILERHENC